MALLEVCCFRPQDAITAFRAGADRIELCDKREAGGTTPPLEWLKEVKQNIPIPVFVMVRPRGGNFVYSDSEFLEMQATIKSLRSSADGFVLGILHDDHSIDVVRTAQLVAAAAPLPCTFHKAFDETPDPLEALAMVIDSGCRALLTSGQASTAQAGVEILSQLVRAARDQVTVIPGGGVRASNLADLQARTGAVVFHSAAARSISQPCCLEIRQLKALMVQRTS